MGWIVGMRGYLVDVDFSGHLFEPSGPCTFLPQVHPFYVTFSINWQGAERTDELRSCRFARARIWCSQFNRLWLRAGALLRIFVYRGRVTIESLRCLSPHLSWSH